MPPDPYTQNLWLTSWIPSQTKGRKVFRYHYNIWCKVVFVWESIHFFGGSGVGPRMRTTLLMEGTAVKVSTWDPRSRSPPPSTWQRFRRSEQSLKQVSNFFCRQSNSHICVFVNISWCPFQARSKPCAEWPTEARLRKSLLCIYAGLDGCLGPRCNYCIVENLKPGGRFTTLSFFNTIVCCFCFIAL